MTPLMHFCAAHGSQKISITPFMSAGTFVWCWAMNSSLTAPRHFTKAWNSLFRCSFLYSVLLKDACEGTILLQIFHLGMSQNCAETILSCLLWLRINYCPFDLLYMYLVLQWPAASRSSDFYYNIMCITFLYSWRVNNLLLCYMYMYIHIFLVRIEIGNIQRMG